MKRDDSDTTTSDNLFSWQRRDFLKGFGLAAGAVATPDLATAKPSTPTEDSNKTPKTARVTLTINGERHQLDIDPRTTLVDLLRENLGMTGTKKGCDHGACGACTVHINGERVLSCLTLAMTANQAEVTTIEGLSTAGEQHPVQEAFLRCDAYQCGYCTPGQIMSATACIAEGHAQGSKEETREWMSGNLCRCSAYPNILAAVRQSAGAEEAVDPAEGKS